MLEQDPGDRGVRVELGDARQEVLRGTDLDRLELNPGPLGRALLLGEVALEGTFARDTDAGEPNGPGPLRRAPVDLRADAGEERLRDRFAVQPLRQGGLRGPRDAGGDNDGPICRPADDGTRLSFTKRI